MKMPLTSGQVDLLQKLIASNSFCHRELMLEVHRTLDVTDAELFSHLDKVFELNDLDAIDFCVRRLLVVHHIEMLSQLSSWMGEKKPGLMEKLPLHTTSVESPPVSCTRDDPPSLVDNQNLHQTTSGRVSSAVNLVPSATCSLGVFSRHTSSYQPSPMDKVRLPDGRVVVVNSADYFEVMKDGKIRQKFSACEFVPEGEPVPLYFSDECTPYSG